MMIAPDVVDAQFKNGISRGAGRLHPSVRDPNEAAKDFAAARPGSRHLYGWDGVICAVVIDGEEVHAFGVHSGQVLHVEIGRVDAGRFLPNF